MTLVVQQVQAQTNYYLKIIPTQSSKLIFNYQQQFTDTLSRTNEINQLINSYYTQGFIFAEIKSKIDSGNYQTNYLETGVKFTWEEIKFSNTWKEILLESNFKEKQFIRKAINPGKLKSLFDAVITYCENNGYPFARIKLDSIQINNGLVKAKLAIELNQIVRIDSVRLIGNSVISKRFLMTYIGIKEGNLYNESLLKAVNARISELPFLKSKFPSQIVFSKTETYLNIFPEKRNANQFDGLIGILPANTTSSKTQLIGQLHLGLLNTFKQAELIDVLFKGQPNSTRDIKLKLNFPFILSSPISLDLLFAVRRQDTTFSQIEQEIGLPYYRRAGNYFKVYFKNSQSNLLSTKGLITATVLPSYADVSSSQYGIGVKEERLDYRNNPRKGFLILMNSSIGNRVIKKNALVNEILYDSLQLNSIQYRLDFKADLFIPIVGRNVVKISTIANWVESPNLFQNELVRFGGINDLRGFDEESIFASELLIYNLEYRFLLDQNSFFQLFYNQAFYQRKINKQLVSDNPFGFGLGVNFETKAGIFTLCYALGKQFNNPISFSTGKIHFGIINYF